MRTALSAVIAASLLLLSAAAARANSPAPWWACDGKAVGEACEQYGGADGTCARQADCTDDTTSAVDECLRCETADSGCSVAAGSGAMAGGGGLLFALAAFAVRRRRH